MDHNILQESDLKNTRRRRAVLNVLESADLPLAADDIYSQVVKKCAYECFHNVSDPCGLV